MKLTDTHKVNLAIECLQDIKAFLGNAVYIRMDGEPNKKQLEISEKYAEIYRVIDLLEE